MFPASLDVERNKIKTKTISRLFKQMIGHLSRDRVIKGLGHLVDQSQGVAVKPASLEGESCVPKPDAFLLESEQEAPQKTLC